MSRTSLGMPALPVGGPAGERPRPDTTELVDQFGRTARDLRISLTTACSLRCTYCMPEEGLPLIPRDLLLTPTEIARLVAIGVQDLGIHEVRFTGGEPLMRADLEEIVALSRAAAPTTELSVTTNGIGLAKRAEKLHRAGLNRVNISLDTLDAQRFATLTRRDRLPAVIAGIQAAKAAGFAPVKVNAVMMRQTLTDAPALLQWAIETGLQLRFIEQMPLDADRQWVRDELVSAHELLTRLATQFQLTEIGREDPSAPAEEWLVDDGPHTVGIIASVTRSFCGACDRTRITPEGTVRSCLFGDHEIDLRGALRDGSSDQVIAQLWRGAAWAKSAGHGMDSADFTPPERSMGAIGG